MDDPILTTSILNGGKRKATQSLYPVIWFSLLLPFLLIEIVVAQCPPPPSSSKSGQTDIAMDTTGDGQKWTQSILLNADVQMEFKWSGDDQEWLLMELSAIGRDVLVLKFQDESALQVAGRNGLVQDIIAVWLDATGQPHVKDFHYRTQGERQDIIEQTINDTETDARWIVEDQLQNYELVSGGRFKNRTTIRFRRRWVNPDPKYDVNVTKTTSLLLKWSYTTDVETLSRYYIHFDYEQNFTRFVFYADPIYCGEGWTNFWRPYKTHVDQTLKLVICIIGLVTNIVNIVVFSQKQMTSATNLILSALALSDLLFVTAELTNQLTGSIMEPPMTHNFSFRIQQLVFDFMYHLFHTWSIYLTLVLAAWRFFGIVDPLKSRIWSTKKRAKLAILSLMALGILVVAPLYVGVTVETDAEALVKRDDDRWRQVGDVYALSECEVIELPDEEIESTTLDDDIMYSGEQESLEEYSSVESATISVDEQRQVALETERTRRLQERQGKVHADFEEFKRTHATIFVIRRSQTSRLLLAWIKGLLIKLIPCAILTLLTCGLIVSLVRARVSRKVLKEPGPKSQDNGGSGSSENRITNMLVVILLIFLVTEFPIGILKMAETLTISSAFFEQCAVPIIPFLSTNEYISSCTSFFIYLAMSRQFRDTLRGIIGCEMFAPKSASTSRSMATATSSL